MNAHTPGPWQVEKGRDKTHPYSVTGDGFDLARCVTVDDAALIAAAPDMLAALKAMLHRFGDSTDRTTQAERMALAAIAKATGGEA
jgi:hypothetical protein